ncbi:MAG: response regulator [Pseudomonadota bacterium]|jgi:CheY-like chemotaxis protein
MGTGKKLGEELMNKKELLLVDDVKLFLHLSRSILCREDFIVHTATNGPDAIDVAKRFRPDAILLDLYMPGMNGDEVCRLLRMDPGTRDIPVIMLTTEADADGRSRSMYSGCDDFITKPVRAGTLNRIVSKHISERKRTHPRLGVFIPCVLDSGDELIKTNIYTLSAGGAYVEIDPPPLPDSSHKLTFSLKDEHDNITVKALARWNRLSRDRRPVGSGFEFVDMSQEESEQLTHWVESKMDDPVFR